MDHTKYPWEMTVAEAEAASGFRVGQPVIGKHYHGHPEGTPSLIQGVVRGFSYQPSYKPTDGTDGTTLWVDIQPDNGDWPFSSTVADVTPV